MSKKNKIPNLKNSSVEELDQYIALMKAQKMVNLEKSLTSNDPENILKAQNYINSISKEKENKAYFFDPFTPPDGKGYKFRRHNVGFETLKHMSRIPLVQVVLKTRISQIQNFLQFQTDTQKNGYTVRKKISRFVERERETPDEEKREIENIVDFLENSRRPSKRSNSVIKFDEAKWDNFEDLDDFIRLIVTDSYTFDQVAVETVKNRKFELLSYRAVDAGTVRYLDTIDPRFRNDSIHHLDEINGYLPRYGQILNGEIARNLETNEPIVWYPWEMAFGIRNKTTDIYSNHYGTSELEILTDVLTYFLWGFQYNGNIFKNGSSPKGILNIVGKSDPNAMENFRSLWRSLVSGPGNAHKIPVLENEKVNWIKMGENNKDMEFNQWMEFLIVMICAVYCIDPTELGFNIKQASHVFGQDGQKQRLDHSKEKGLKPMLMFLQKFISKYIVEEINPDYEFVFTGVDVDDEATIIENDKKKVDMGAMSLEDVFKKYSGRELTDDDTILNSIAAQYKQQAMMGGPMENEMVGEEGGFPGEEGEPVKEEPSPEDADQFFKSIRTEAKVNPIIKSSLDYIDKNFYIDE